jgi:GNAT superfamily N-acetyltransferase
MPPQHYTSTLQTMGTARAKQGKDIGSDVVNAGIARADARGVPCSLESSNPRNVHFPEAELA